ncbi:MAG: PIG-L family deacetylase [Actinobacteria bacterium]|nr:PIG-L family deacetylase [Actinomycetota bacterium]
MRRMAAAHLPLAAAWLTRGGLHGDRREAESRCAMRLIGVEPRNQFFFRLPDGKVLDFMDEIVARLGRLVSELRPASVFVPAFEGGHPDHDAAQLAMVLSLSHQSSGAGADAAPALFEFPLYSRAGARILKVGQFIPATTPVERTPMKLSDRLLKRKLVVGCFRSQRSLLWPLTGIRGGPMMVHVQGEPYRRVPRGRDYAIRPHPGRLAYEFYTAWRFGDFAEVAARITGS